MNIKSAYLHLFSDMLTSIAVLIGGIAIKYLHWYRIDSIFSIAISIYLLYSSWGILKSALRIIMQFTPKNIDIKKIIEIIIAIPKVKNTHHVHIWQINEHDIMFEAHIDLLEDISITEFEQILIEIKELLAQFGIGHITIQPEFSVSDKKQI